MDEIRSRISPQDLYKVIGTATAPVLVDVRRPAEFEADDAMIVRAIRRSTDDVEGWYGLPQGRLIVPYCVDGRQVSQAVAAGLTASGFEARYLEGGISAWRELSLPTRRKVGASPGKWVTRERPKVDRIACPWLVRRFIDPEAEFFYVPSAEVRDIATKVGGIPYDISGAEFGHVADQCSFDAFIRLFDIHDRALDRLALIVRGADTGKPELTPQSPGLVALAYGLSDTFPDDHAMLDAGMIVYDALYAWCRRQEAALA